MADDYGLTSAGTPLVPLYVAGLMPTPQQGTHPREFVPPTPTDLPIVVLIAWGADPTQAAMAFRQGAAHARSAPFSVRESLTSYGGDMDKAPLVAIALGAFRRREITATRAWWLVRHSAISPRDMELARTRLRQAWAHEAAQEGRA